MTSVLGISAFYHDSAACIVVDGEVIAAAQEERFTRIKHDHHFPSNAVAYCLKEARLSVENLDHVGFYDKPFLKFDRLLETYLDYAPAGFRSFLKVMPLWIKEKLWMPDVIRLELAKVGGAGDERAAMVCTPEDSYRCFMRTEMDVLVLEQFLLKKEEQPNFKERTDRRSEFVLD